MSEWQEFSLNKLCTVTSSKRIFRHEYVGSGIPFYRSKEIIEKAFGETITECLFISEERFNEIKDKFGSPQAGDILISSVGARSGIPYLVKEQDGEFYFKDGNLIWIKDFSEQINSNFLVYWLQSHIGQDSLESIMIGSAQPALTIVGMSDLNLTIPDAAEQENISAVLSSLDRKIENLRRQNETLDAIAHSLFKHWFVDFEFPNADGKPYKSSGGTMEPSELGEIPTGWRVGAVEDIVDVFTGFPFKSDLYSFDSGIRVVRGENVSLGFLRWDTEKRWDHDLDSYSDYFLQRDDYVIGMDGSRVGRNRTIILNSDLPLILAQRVARLRANNPNFSGYINVFLKQNRFERYVDFIKTGTSIPHISATQIKEFECLIPTVDVVEAFQKFYKPWSEKISSHLGQIETLTKTRDALLPKLMSGKLRITS